MEERSWQLKRRDMLKLIMLGSGAVLVPGVFSGCGAKRDMSQTNFPNSVASGDPRESSVILWTRVEDTLQDAEADLDVELEVAKDERFEEVVFSKTVTAYAVYKRCIKIRVDQLEPYSYYYFRFRYNRVYSRTGRTKTAPSAAENRKIRLATVSCQDYPGRYYNTYAHMLQFDDIDAVVHLGDYIYETSGDPTTLLSDENRKVVFRDTEGVIALQEGETTYYAAASLDNYRQLYELYRSDEMLQQIHERFPMIAVWDDHEYSDDHFASNANYFGGRKNESDPQRRQNAQRAYLEYMPLEVGLDARNEMSPQSEIMLDDTGKAVIYRDFHYGANVHLIMSDYRSYRPDHIIPEDAFPGTVFADKQQLISFYEQQLGGGEAEYEANRALFGPYIDLDLPPYDSYKTLLIQVLTVMYASDGINLIDAALRASVATQGKISAFVANEMIKGYNDTVSANAQQPLIYQESGDAVYNALEFGLAYITWARAISLQPAG